MKAPLHFKSFIKKLFCYENNELVINREYAEKVYAQNIHHMTDPILCYIDCAHVDAFKVEYERDIAGIECFNISPDPFHPSVRDLPGYLNIIASFDVGHARHYIIHIELLREYIRKNHIINNPGTSQKVGKDIEEKGEITASRYEIMEIQ